MDVKKLEEGEVLPPGFFAGYKFFPEREAQGQKPHMVVIGHPIGREDIEVVDVEVFDTKEEAEIWRDRALKRWNTN